MTKPNKRLLKQKNAENSLIRHLGVLETKMHNYATKTGVFLLLCRSAALLPLPPLRTVRAIFTAYSSDNSKFNSHKIKSAHNHLLMTCFR